MVHTHRFWQFNIAAFVVDYSTPIGSTKLPKSVQSNSSATTDEVVAAFPSSDFGPDVVALLKCLQSPGKWHINIVSPHLKSYARGRVALLGDAVSVIIHSAPRMLRLTSRFRHTGCCPI